MEVMRKLSRSKICLESFDRNERTNEESKALEIDVDTSRVWPSQKVSKGSEGERVSENPSKVGNFTSYYDAAAEESDAERRQRWDEYNRSIENGMRKENAVCMRKYENHEIEIMCIYERKHRKC